MKCGCVDIWVEGIFSCLVLFASLLALTLIVEKKTHLNVLLVNRKWQEILRCLKVDYFLVLISLSFCIKDLLLWVLAQTMTTLFFNYFLQKVYMYFRGQKWRWGLGESSKMRLSSRKYEHLIFSFIQPVVFDVNIGDSVDFGSGSVPSIYHVYFYSLCPYQDNFHSIGVP